ncbi:Gfo/Idh/MocA family oxidoreductase [Georgenia deserti]|uniref:Gfo/Idh/MocA family oxidoreductase n=1 Tax=Georgenia deserti TaxID=2093781 RepID=A0ABW4L3P1_9MICO
MSAPLGVGVVGLGAMGASHVDTLVTQVPGTAVTAVHDADAGRGAEAAARLSAREATDPLDLVADPGVDAVVVCSPDPTHLEIVLACVRAGKPVLCEKPLGVTAEESAQVVEAESAAGRRLVTVGFMRRFDPAYLDLREAVAAGAVGRPVLVHNVHRNAAPHPAATDESVVVNSMVHELDVLPWLLGGAVTGVHVRAPQGEGLRDPQLAVVELDGGRVLASVEVYLAARYGYDIRCEVVGTDGTVALRPPGTLVHAVAGSQGTPVPADFRIRFAEAYRRELLAWAGAAREGGATGATAWDGHVANLVSAAGVQSLHSGQSVAVPAASVPELYR